MGFSDFFNHSVFSEKSEDILRYEGVHVFPSDERSNKITNGGNRNEKDDVVLEQVHLHYGNGSRSLECEQYLWLYGISAGCP